MSKLSHLKNCEVLEDTVLHVSFRQVFEFQDKVDHVFTHWTAVYLVQIPPPFISRVLSLHLLHHLLPEAADLGGALDGHVLCTLVTATTNDKRSERDVRTQLRIIPKCTIIAGCRLIVMRRTVILQSLNSIRAMVV